MTEFLNIPHIQGVPKSESTTFEG